MDETETTPKAETKTEKRLMALTKMTSLPRGEARRPP
jgi:hypothetical protein